jgi:prepilin-type N-terminal cleavage/methylation domain-containing protein
MRSAFCRPASGGPRAGFTLLEVMLAMSIGVVLLGALYVAVNVQLKSAQAGRDLVQQSTLVRSLFNSISNDVVPTVNLVNASRFRMPQGGMGGGGGGGMGGGGSGGAGGTTGTGTTGATGTGGSSGSQSGTQAGATDAVTFPFGIQGDSQTMSVYINKVPTEVFLPPGSSDLPPPVSDTRRITFWLAPGGLARQEVKIITSQDVTNLMPPDLPDGAYRVLAPEVQSLTFSYFDGNEWQDTWDSTMVGGDGVTPIGPPREVAITIGLANPAGGDLKTYRHCIAIPTADGTQVSTGGTLSAAPPGTPAVNSTTTGGGTSP